MNDVLSELRSRRRRKPFEPFVMVLKDGRRFAVTRMLQFAFTEDRVVVFDDQDLTNYFKLTDIAELETLHPVA